MPRKKSKNADVDPREKGPKLSFYSLENQHSDLDFFPHLGTSGNSQHSQTIGSLKNGTYNLFMQGMEYEADYKKKEKMFTATLKNKDIIASPTDKVFTGNVQTLEQDRIKSLDELYGQNNLPIRRRFYANPRQYYDHILLADAYTNSFAGTVIDTWCDFNIPRNIKPVIKLRRPSGNSKADAKKIKSFKFVLEELNGIDMWYSDMGPKANDTHFDISIQQKFKAAFKLREVFGRDVIVKEHWKDYGVVNSGKIEYKNMPNVLKIMHPIELGITEVDVYSGKIAGLWVSNDQPYIPMANMIHLVNEYASPMIGSMGYGSSKLQRAIDAVRLYRRLMAKSFPQFLRVSSSGMGAFLINTTGFDKATRQRIRLELKNMYKSSEMAVVDYANIKDFSYQEFKINTDINALVQLQDAMLKTISNVTGIPQSIAYDDSAPARATLVGRLVSFINYQVNQSRNTFRQQLASQWYMPNARIAYQDTDKNVLEEIYIDVEFEDVSLETKQEKIDRLLQETVLNNYTDEYIGQELEDPDYINHIDAAKNKKEDEQAKSNPMGAAESKKKKTGEVTSIRDHSTGQTSKVSSK